MTGSEPKEGGGFELYVAAALKFEVQKTSGRDVDLRDYYFNPVPKTYPKQLTNAGYDVTVDISATSSEENLEYAIECKSSIHRDQILEAKSKQFLDAMLEFLALQKLVELSNWRFNYILAANFPISRKISTLIKTRSPDQLSALRKMIINYGSKEKSEFRSGIVSIVRLGKILGNLILIEFSDQYLNKMKQNVDYMKLYDSFSEQLKKIRPSGISENAGEVSRFERVSFLCSDPEHLNCVDISVNSVVFHLGNIVELKAKLLPLEKNIKHLKIVKLVELGYSIQTIAASNNCSTKEVAAIISAGLNKCLKPYSLIYVVPGTYDIIFVNPEDLVEHIKTSYKNKTMKYVLDEVKELDGLGSEVKISIARSIFAFYHIGYNEDDFLADD